MNSAAFDLVVDGCRLEAIRIGAPGQALPTLVFLHEGLGSAELWRDVPAEICAATGLPGLVYSRAGYGRSDPKTLPWPQSYMHDEAALLPALFDAAGIDRAILIGHSDGASIALIAAATIGDRVLAVVAEAPHVIVERDPLGHIATVAETYESSGLRAKLARYHDHVDVAFHGWSGAWIAFDDWDLRPLLTDVAVPLLVIQGRDDPYGTVAQIDAIADGAAGSVTEMLLDDCAHTPHREQRSVVLPAIAAFVGSVIVD